MNSNRIICWFSCGAASAVATKVAIAENAGRLPLRVVYSGVINEHDDNRRFLKECQRWFAEPIEVITNARYQGDIYQVFEGVRYLVGPDGAACTRILKKEMRKQFERPRDRQVFGYTSEENDRADRFIDANNGVDLWTPLIDRGLSKADCLAMLREARIEIPMMYRLGYKNNNCIGCVKGGAGYWNKIRIDFPDHFARMAAMERKLGVKINKYQEGGVRRRVYLDELPPSAGNYEAEDDIECGVVCQTARDDSDAYDNTEL